MTEKEIFAIKLRRCRLEKKMSQRYLADCCGISQQSIANFESFKTSILPQFNSLKQICLILDVSADYLLGL